MAESSVVGRHASFFVVQLASVLAPGLVLVGELAFIVIVLTGPVDRELVATAEQAVFERGVPLFVVGTLLFAGAVLVGYLAREVAFALLLIVERHVPPFGIPQLQAELVGMFGRDAIAEVVGRHPVLTPLSLPVADPVKAQSGAYLQGWGKDPGTTRVFVYSKLWLRSKAAAFSVDQIELEINSVLAMLLPTLLLAIDVVVVLQGTGQVVAALVSTIVVVLVWIFVLRRGVKLRRAERWEAVRNLFFSHLMDATRPAAAGPTMPGPRVPVTEAE